MPDKVLITLKDHCVAPRFDLTAEVLIATVDPDRTIRSKRTFVLSHASAEDLCHLILTEQVGALICGGIEEEYYQYLTWKKVRVLDSVMGPWEQALVRWVDGTLQEGTILYDRPARLPHA